MTIRVLLAAPPSFMSDALSAWLSNLGPDVVVTCCERSPVPTTSEIDLILLDVDGQSEESILACIQEFRHSLKGKPLVVTASSVNEQFAQTVKDAGTSAYLCKCSAASEALELLRALVKRPIGQSANDRAVEDKRAKLAIPYGLTPREMEILDLACGGLSNLEIARRCGITEGVVKLHLHHAYGKLGVHGRLQAVRIIEHIEGIRAMRMERSEAGVELLDWLLPHMVHETHRKGDILFKKGDPGAALYYVQKGCIRLNEIDVEMLAGDLFGEIGIFAPGHARTCSARCETESQLFRLSADDARRLCFENPQFAYYVIGLVADRLVEERLQSRQR